MAYEVCLFGESVKYIRQSDKTNAQLLTSTYFYSKTVIILTDISNNLAIIWINWSENSRHVVYWRSTSDWLLNLIIVIIYHLIMSRKQQKIELEYLKKLVW